MGADHADGSGGGGMAALAVLWSDPAMADPVPDGTVRYVAWAIPAPRVPTWRRSRCTTVASGRSRDIRGVVARALHADSFTNVSCSGATTENLTTASQSTATGAVRPQIDALRPDTTLVTVGIGGNDIAWQSLVAPCYTTVPGTDAHCRTDPETIGGMTSALAALEPKVSAALAAIEERAPRARVLLVGHGGIFGAHGCWPNIPTSDADAAWISGFFVRMNQVLAAAATATGGPVRGRCEPRHRTRCLRRTRTAMVRRPAPAVFRRVVAPHHRRNAGDRRPGPDRLGYTPRVGRPLSNGSSCHLPSRVIASCSRRSPVRLVHRDRPPIEAGSRRWILIPTGVLWRSPSTVKWNHRGTPHTLMGAHAVRSVGYAVRSVGYMVRRNGRTGPARRWASGCCPVEGPHLVLDAGPAVR